jgi:ABC-2 type transport system ATP-binding protein
MDIVIQTQQLSNRFGAIQAVDHLDVSVPKGAIFALLGENGAGKTTTIRMLTGLEPPDSGRAMILGQDCWASAVALRGKVGYFPEWPRYYDWMTVTEPGWFAAGFHAPGYKQRYLDWTNRFQLDAKARLSRLSKGEYAKVGLALAVDPEVLIPDEPTSGLDRLNGAQRTLHLKPGQALIWSDREDTFRAEGARSENRRLFPVPVWKANSGS